MISTIFKFSFIYEEGDDVVTVYRRVGIREFSDFSSHELDALE